MAARALSTDIVFLGAERTAFDIFNGALKDLTATDLGVHASKAALAQSFPAAPSATPSNADDQPPHVHARAG